MAVQVNGTEMILSGTVGDLFWSDCFLYGDVIFALAAIGRDQDITVRLNSGGGIATEGAAIHAALRAHKGKKTVVVEGIAASAASVIAMAGDEIVMSLGALMMIHDPSGFTFGTVADHEKQVQALNSLGDAMAGIYADRSGKAVEACRAEMREEVWLTPEAAVAAGYADRVGMVAANDAGAPEIVDVDAGAEPVEPTAFNYRLFQHPPERLVALADRNGWAQRPRVMAAQPAATNRQKGLPMPTDQAGSKPVTQPLTDNVVALDAARVEGRTQALAYARQVRDICALAGQPQLADDFIEKDTAPEAVAKALLDKRAEADRATAVTGQHAAATATAPKQLLSGAESMKRQLKIGG